MLGKPFDGCRNIGEGTTRNLLAEVINLLWNVKNLLLNILLQDLAFTLNLIICVVFRKLAIKRKKNLYLLPNLATKFEVPFNLS